MLKKLLTAGILLCASLSMSAHAGLIGITGSFDISGDGETTLNAAGEITRIVFSDLEIKRPSGSYLPDPIGDFKTNFAMKENSLLLPNIDGKIDVNNKILWTFFGFTFTGLEVIENKTNGRSTGLYIIGNVSHADFITTKTEWFFSTQGLKNNGTTLTTFSSKITSPAPSQVPESATLALLCLGLMGFRLRRNKK
jgi:hypothetical protein